MEKIATPSLISQLRELRDYTVVQQELIRHSIIDDLSYTIALQREIVSVMRNNHLLTTPDGYDVSKLEEVILKNQKKLRSYKRKLKKLTQPCKNF
jgi:hypothetical protein